MPSRTEKFLAEIREWCNEERGRRSELARIVGTSPQIVTDWLVVPNRKTPTLEQALEIQELLKKERRKSRARAL